MEKENKKGLSCREVVTRHLRIFVSDGTVNERKEIRRLFLMGRLTSERKSEDPGLRISGMTGLYFITAKHLRSLNF